MNNKLFQLTLIGLVAIGVLAIIVFVLFSMTSGDQAPPVAQEEPQLSLDEMVELSMDMAPITTNLYSNEYIIVQFNLMVNNDSAKDELEKRMPEVRSATISLLASKTPEDLRGNVGIRDFEDELQERLNGILEEGQVQRVLTIDRQLQ